MTYKQKCPKLPWMVDFYTTENGKVYNTQMEAAFADTTMNYLSSLNIKSCPKSFRETQLIATVNQFVSVVDMENMMKLNVRVFNISATGNEKMLEILSKARAVNANFSRQTGKLYPLGYAVEIRGPEIRTGQVKYPKTRVSLEKGQITYLTANPMHEEHVTEDMIFVDYENLNIVVQRGDKVVLNNGSVTLTTLEVIESLIKCVVERAGDIISNCSVIVPNVPEEARAFPEESQKLLHQCIKEKVDYLFLSGIYNKDCVVDIKGLLGQEGQFITIITKVDNNTGIENIDKIIEVSDAICLDCDKLMIELPREKVFLIQKSITAKCNLAGKPLICSTKFCDLMFFSKAEVCDIANSIMDGADALLLPTECCRQDVVQRISSICREAEPAIHERRLFSELTNNVACPTEAIYALAISAIESAVKSGAAAIICLSSSGRTAKLLSRFRPRCPIIVVTRYPRTARQLGIFKSVDAVVNVKPFEGNWDKNVELRLRLGVAYGKYLGYIRAGDVVVTVAGNRPETGLANNIQVMHASDFDALPRKQKGA